MSSKQAAQLRTTINELARQLENETDSYKQLKLKRAIRAAEFQLTEG